MRFLAVGWLQNHSVPLRKLDAPLLSAHLLSPARRQLPAELRIRSGLDETRSCYVTTIRRLARAEGVLLPRCEPEHLGRRLSEQQLSEGFGRIAPLLEVLGVLEKQLDEVEPTILKLVEHDPAVVLCATIPGVSQQRRHAAVLEIAAKKCLLTKICG